jgi:hypothetical protein
MNLEPRHLRLLGQFQLLEFSLKLYIAFSHEIIRSKLAGAIPFKYEFEQIDGYPLEKLLANFKLLNDNVELQARLGKLVKKRNAVAHKALLFQDLGFTNLVAGLYNIDHSELLRDLGETEREVDGCMEQLAPELANVKAKYVAARA